MADEILVGLEDVALDPVCDRTERIEVAFGELARSADLLEVFEEEEVRGLCGCGPCRHRLPFELARDPA